MKNVIVTLFIGIIFLAGNDALAQKGNLSLSFAAEHSVTAGHIQIDSLYIANTNVGCDTTLYDPSPYIVFTFLGIENYLSNSEGKSLHLVAYPNPVSTNTTIEAVISQSGQYRAMLYNSLGQIERINILDLQAGKHSFEVGLKESGVYNFVLSNRNFSGSIKLVNSEGNSSTGSFVQVESNDFATSPATSNLKSITFTDGFEFVPGDMLQIIAYAHNYFNDTIEIAPIESEDIIIQMNPVPGCPDVFYDYDGNAYTATNIDGQCWMAQNLKVTHFSDGTDIPLAASYSAWTALTVSDPGYCYYGNDSNNVAIYGLLYNWAAAMNGDTSTVNNPSGVNGACPTGWHLPSDAEWDELGAFIADDNGGMASGYQFTDGNWKKVGKHLKSTTAWTTAGTDDYSFNGLPAGYRAYSGSFTDIEVNANWWTTTEVNANIANGWGLEDSSHKFLHLTLAYKLGGFSVRCIRD